MKKLFLLLASCLCLSAHAQEDDWVAVPIPEDIAIDGVRLYISPSRITTDPTDANQRIAFTVFSMSNSAELKSALVEMVIDCDNATFAIRRMTAYPEDYAKDSVVHENLMDPIESEVLDSEGPRDEMLFNMACNKSLAN